ncbi:hypothetical protein ACFW2T_27495 [Streptomyces sp. NPDC058892]|uniref:hypothetical protein n=1 Tax=unclassified Streptomyces TaxID=2593676 RepID=UPI003696542F
MRLGRPRRRGRRAAPADRALAFFDDVEAPVKEFALIEDASHFASFRHPDLMLTRVRPVAVMASGAATA